MLDALVPGIVLGIIGLTIYKILELYVRKSERMKIIDKLNEIQSIESFPNPDSLFKSGSNVFSSVKIGLLLIGVGVGAIVGIFFQVMLTDSLSPNFAQLNDQVQDNTFDLISMIYFACISSFGGIGLVVAYFLEKKGK